MDYVAYYRVSTKKQGESGLGLKAQRETVYKFISPDDHVIHEYTEIETATGTKERPELSKAVKMCRQSGATLICARMDRLYRNVYMMAKLMESKVDFVFCDFPMASKMTIQILSVLSEYEADRISKNTKLALEQVRKHGSKSGKKIGNPGGWNHKDRKMGPISKYKAFLDNPMNKMAYAFVEQISFTTKASSKLIAMSLNKNSYKTHANKEWTPSDVIKLKRIFTSIKIREEVAEFERYKIDKEIESISKINTNS